MEPCVQEKRRFERYAASFPVMLYRPGSPQPQPAATRDVSAGGACLSGVAGLQVGDCVSLELMLDNETIQTITGRQPRLQARATVVRCEEHCVALSFSSCSALAVPCQRDH